MPRHARRVLRVRLLIAPVAAACLVAPAQLAFSAPTLASGASCTFDLTHHRDTVTLTSQSLTFTSIGGDLEVNGTPCGTVDTVTEVDTDMADVNDAFLTLDMAGGQFAPGANPAAEIKFPVTDLGSDVSVLVEGTTGPDKVTVGDRHLVGGTLVTGIDLNGFAESAPAEDVVLHGQTAEIGLYGDAGADVLSGAGTGTPLSRATNTRMVLNDGPGADTVTGGNNIDTIGPQEGPDPGDVFSGGAGFDFIDFESWNQGVTVSLDGKANDGADCPTNCDDDNVMPDIESVRGTQHNDVLRGGSGDDRIEGLGGTNVISGGAGDDQLSGGSGKDTFHGGPGFDIVSDFSETDPITVTLDGEANDGATGEHDNVEPDVEGVYGGSGNDHLTGDAADNTLVGGPGNDVLNGMGGNDTLDGGGTTFGADGSDVFIGGPGIDTVLEDTLYADLNLSIDGRKNDQVVGHPEDGVDNIHTDVENMTGGTGNDRITGDAGRNVLTGGAGNDTLIGLGGNDVLEPGSGKDHVFGGAGADTASYLDAPGSVLVDLVAGAASGNGQDTLSSVENLTGSKFADHLVGSNGPNTVLGGPGNDALKGLAGNDRLDGGLGNDSLDGGPGTDVCDQGPGTGARVHCEH